MLIMGARYKPEYHARAYGAVVLIIIPQNGENAIPDLSYLLDFAKVLAIPTYHPAGAHIHCKTYTSGRYARITICHKEVFANEILHL